MKFVNFSEAAINCLSLREWRDFASLDEEIAKKNSDLKDPTTQELYIAYLYLDFQNVDYDSVKRYGPRDQLCEYAYIYYSKEEKCWCFDEEKSLKFKSLEDAKKAAELCAIAGDHESGLKAIARAFPEFKMQILELLLLSDTNHI